MVFCPYCGREIDEKDLVEGKAKEVASKLQGRIRWYKFVFAGLDDELHLGINADPKEVERLLEKHKKEHAYYTVDSFIRFLEEKGYKVKSLELEGSFRF